MGIDTRSIRSESHVEIGSLIYQDADILVARWCERAIEEQPTAKRVHYDVLRDQLIPFLQATGRALKQVGNTEAGSHCTPALEHGEQRWDNGWSLSELVRDYQLLQLVILEYLEQTLDRPLRYREVMAVGVFIDDAVAASIATYVASRDEYIHHVEAERIEVLQQSNRRKDEFMAILGHELRNPLAPIRNSVKVLQLVLNTADPNVLEPVAMIERQSRQLVRLVDDLLDVARIGQGSFELRKTQLDLTSVLEQAVQMNGPDLEVRDQRLSVALPTEPLLLEGDPGRLVQIVVNLLNNAVKYTERGGNIWLTGERDKDEAVIRVRDNGVGIPPEMVSQIFELFTQVDKSRHYTQGGLGIGLTLVKRLVELHGGTVTCQSEGIGRGSEFIVRLPAEVILINRSLPESPQAPCDAPSCHVLIIEDSADARNAMANLLKLIGHRVEVAENGERGIECALAARPQVALIDIGRPDLSGHEVAKRLRQALGQSIFLIALTGYGQTDDLRQALDAGFDAHVVKPADLETLSRLLIRASTNSANN